MDDTNSPFSSFRPGSLITMLFTVSTCVVMKVHLLTLAAV